MAATVKRLLHLCLLIGLIGTAGDLLLIGHYGDPWQWTPVLLVSAAGAALAWCSCAPSQGAVRTFRVTMLLLIGAAALGLWLHLRANLEFEREVSPSLEGTALIWKAIRGASPPTLAPAALLQLALLGLAYSHLYFAAGGARQRPAQTGAAR